jgi:hypothetical protein
MALLTSAGALRYRRVALEPLAPFEPPAGSRRHVGTTFVVSG